MYTIPPSGGFPNYQRGALWANVGPAVNSLILPEKDFTTFMPFFIWKEETSLGQRTRSDFLFLLKLQRHCTLWLMPPSTLFPTIYLLSKPVPVPVSLPSATYPSPYFNQVLVTVRHRRRPSHTAQHGLPSKNLVTNIPFQPQRWDGTLSLSFSIVASLN